MRFNSRMCRFLFAFELFIFDLKIQLFLLQRRLPQPQDFIGLVPITDRSAEDKNVTRVFLARCSTSLTFYLNHRSISSHRYCFHPEWRINPNDLWRVISNLVSLEVFSFTSHMGRRRSRLRRSRSSSSRARWMSSCCLQCTFEVMLDAQ